MRGKKRILEECEIRIDEKTQVTWELLCDIRDLLRKLVDKKKWDI